MSDRTFTRLSQLGPLVTLVLAMLGVAVAWGSSQALLTAMREDQKTMVARVEKIAEDVGMMRSRSETNGERIAFLKERIERLEERR